MSSPTSRAAIGSEPRSAQPARPDPPSSSGWAKPLVPIFATVLVDVLALTLILPLLPFLAQHHGASPLVVGLLFASFSACQLVSGPILGRLSDRHGRKPVLMVSQVGTALGLLMMGLSDRLEWLFVGRMLDGLTAGNLSIAQAYIADVTRPEHRTKSFGLIGIAFGLGFLIGPAASGLLAARHGFHAPLFAAAGLSAFSVVLTGVLLPKTPPVSASTNERGASAAHASADRRAGAFSALRNPAARGRLAELFFYVASFSVLTSGLGLFLQRRFDFGVEETGWVFAFAGLVGALAQGGIGRIVRRLGEARLSVVGLTMVIVGMATVSVAGSLALLLVAVAIHGLGSAVVRPTLTTLLTTSVGEGERGVSLGVHQSLSSAAQTAGPLVAGALIASGALATWAWASAVLAALALAVRALVPVRGSAPAHAESTGGASR
jgi:MFS transporter, DHA1 family, tetracycline resistance protein